MSWRRRGGGSETPDDRGSCVRTQFKLVSVVVIMKFVYLNYYWMLDPWAAGWGEAGLGD